MFRILTELWKYDTIGVVGDTGEYGHLVPSPNKFGNQVIDSEILGPEILRNNQQLHMTLTQYFFHTTRFT